jgi:hypothetical protein
VVFFALKLGEQVSALHCVLCPLSSYEPSRVGPRLKGIYYKLLTCKVDAHNLLTDPHICVITLPTQPAQHCTACTPQVAVGCRTCSTIASRNRSHALQFAQPSNSHTQHTPAAKATLTHTQPPHKTKTSTQAVAGTQNTKTRTSRRITPQLAQFDVFGCLLTGFTLPDTFCRPCSQSARRQLGDQSEPLAALLSLPSQN